MSEIRPKLTVPWWLAKDGNAATSDIHAQQAVLTLLAIGPVLHSVGPNIIAAPTNKIVPTKIAPTIYLPTRN